MTDLSIYISELKTASAYDNKAFQSLIARGLILLELKDMDLAELVRTSSPTVFNWKHGMSFPYPSLRPSIYAILLKLAEERSY